MELRGLSPFAEKSLYGEGCFWRIVRGRRSFCNKTRGLLYEHIQLKYRSTPISEQGSASQTGGFSVPLMLSSLISPQMSNRWMESLETTFQCRVDLKLSMQTGSYGSHEDHATHTTAQATWFKTEHEKTSRVYLRWRESAGRDGRMDLRIRWRR